jgi:hypothetical protein
MNDVDTTPSVPPEVRASGVLPKEGRGSLVVGKRIPARLSESINRTAFFHSVLD